jgi:arginyl-tRNA synthetase
MFQSEKDHIEEGIRQFCGEHGLPQPSPEWKGIPFSGHWGISTSFFQLAAQEARQGKKVNVPQRAQEIAQQVADYLGQPAGFERIEAVRGYLNLYFSSGEYAKRVIDSVIELGDTFGRGESKGQKVMVEFSQPNTHKAFHVGHLRNAILGNSVCNILAFAGYEVVRANYIGDIGLHVMKWMWNYRKNHAGEEPTEDTTRWMGDLYAEADRLYESSAEVQAEVKTLFGRWDRHDPELIALWQKTRQWSLDGFDQIYEMLGIPFDRIYFESDVEFSGKDVVQELIKRGIARDERPENPVIVPLDDLLGTDQEYRVLVILRSDGTSLYSTKDLALAIQKFDEYALDRSIYVIDVRQSLYMKQIFKTLEIMGYPWAENCFHLAYEIVNLPGNVTMSSREGTVVLLDDLTREAVQRALDIVQEKNPELSEDLQIEIANQVALGAIKYPMVSRDNIKVVTFDWESALDFNGQASPYIQYAAVRAGSILRRLESDLPGSVLPDYDLTPAEIQLVEEMSRLPQEVQRAARELRPMLLANLAYDLARAFSDFYKDCPVLQAEEPVRQARLRMVIAARQVIKNTLYLLGIETPEVM